MHITVAACQTHADVQRPDPSYIDHAVRQAAAQGATLIVLPELAVSGYCFESVEEARAAAEPVDGPTVDRLRSLSAELNCAIVGGFCELGESGELYNSAAIVDGGELLQCYRKAHLWGREPDWFSAGGQHPVPVETRAGRVAVMICYDLEFPEWVRLAAQAGADIIAVPCNWPLTHHPAGERPLDLVKAQAAAGTNRVHIVVADRCGTERGVDWIGGSVVIHSSGYPVAGPATTDGEAASPAILTADLDLEAARNKLLGDRNHAFADRRPRLYGESPSQ